MDAKQMVKQMREEEGVVPYAYQDSLGYLTIGVGHLIDKRKGGKLSDAAIDFILMEDINNAIADLDRELPWWKTLTENRQRVLISMCFNLGIDGLLGFKNTLAMIKKGDYEGAAKGMLNSKWATQVKSRATKLSQMMRDG